MRLGWIVSLIGHVLAVFLTVVNWPASAARDVERGAVVPVEIITLSDVTSVRAIAPPEPEEEVEAEESTPAEEEPEPAPEPAPPQERPRERPLQDFLSEVQTSLLRDKQKEKRQAQRRIEGERGERARAAAGLGAAETADLNAYLGRIMRDHLRRNRCWRAPADLPNPERLIVTVSFRLNARGRLLGNPQLVSPATTFGDPPMRAAVDAAIRAIHACDPYPFPEDEQAREHYDVWRDMEFTFDPSQLSG
jgi:hypothetical protein